MNETIKNILERYSCREFLDKLPSDEDLNTIAKCAVAAPSGVNRQSWRVVVVKDKALIDELEKESMENLSKLPDQTIYERIISRGGKMLYNAPCVVFVPIDATEMPAMKEMLDAGILTQNICLSAQSLGLNSLICGLLAFAFSGEKAEYFKKKLQFPEGYEFGIAVLLGYETKPGTPHVLDMEKITFIG